jgi:hypothetical protein
MEAILISDENMPKIAQSGLLSERDESALDRYLGSKTDWYLIRSYLDTHGSIQPWTIRPAYILRRDFEFQPDLFKSAWNVLYRK